VSSLESERPRNFLKVRRPKFGPQLEIRTKNKRRKREGKKVVTGENCILENKKGPKKIGGDRGSEKNRKNFPQFKMSCGRQWQGRTSKKARKP